MAVVAGTRLYRRRECAGTLPENASAIIDRLGRILGQIVRRISMSVMNQPPDTERAAKRTKLNVSVRPIPVGQHRRLDFLKRDIGVHRYYI